MTEPVSLPLDLRPAQLWQEGVVEFHGIRRSKNDWRMDGQSKLWCYERHYHSELPGLAWLSVDDARSLVDDWVANNPPCAGVAWDAYPVARRLLNWSMACAIAPALRAHLAPWLAAQMRFLSMHLERHLLGNHLLCDLCGLVAASATVETTDSEKLALWAASLLERELQRQVLPDGGYIERTAQYHLIVLQDALLALLLHQARGRKLNAEPVLNRMLVWAGQVRRPDGSYPWLNDAAPDATPSLEMIVGLAIAAGFRPPAAVPNPAVIELPDTGWSIIRENGHELLFEHGIVGPEHQPGHGHADALSFELIWAGRPVVSDTGISTYAVGDVRSFERSAMAHSTISVDGEGTDETWASFRVGGRARVEYLGHDAPWPGSWLLRARTQSYRGWTHLRALLFLPGRLLLVCEEVRGVLSGGGILSNLPLAPDWQAAADATGWSLTSPALQLKISVLKGHPVGLSSHGGWVGRGFGRTERRISLQMAPHQDGQLIYGIVAGDLAVSLRADQVMVPSTGSSQIIELAEIFA